MDKYTKLVTFLLTGYGVSRRLANVPDAPEYVKGMADAEADLLAWVAGLEGTDLDGLRQKFKVPDEQREV